MKMIEKEKKALELCYTKGYLNEEGLNRHIDYLYGKIKDYSMRIIEVTNTKTFQGEDLKEANKRAKKNKVKKI